MRLAILDCEADNLLEDLTKIHSLVLRDYVTDEVVSCADQPGYRPIAEGLEIASKAEVIFAHNGIAYDIPALKKVFPKWEYSGRVFDTLVASRTRWAHIKETDFALLRKGKIPGQFVGRHSIEAWGHRLGVRKVGTDITDWSKWTPEMQARCETDTLIPKKLLLRLKNSGYSQDAIDCEMELAWLLAAMERGGFPFNIEKAQQLQATLAGKRETKAQVLRDTFGQMIRRDGKPFTPKRDNQKKGVFAGCVYQKVKIIDFNPASRDHIAERLTTLYGWKPTEFTDSGKPMVDDGTLKGLPYPPIPDLCEFLLLDKRLGQLSEGKEAWLKLATNTRAEGGAITGMHHIHGSINAGGTVTHRASHSRPNISQVPKVGKPYGSECRSLFTVPDGWNLIGADMSGLELRCLAHYMARWDDMAYGRTILEGKNEDGTDIHSVNMRVLAAIATLTRDTAKTWFYAYLYGAGDAKLGWILNPALSEDAAKKLGRKARKQFEGGLPALGYLIDALKKKMKATAGGPEGSYINLIDGRKAFVRSEHSVLNTLLQGTGAVLCKHWMNESARRITAEIGPMGWDKNWCRCTWPHDEVQDAVRAQYTERVSLILVQSAEAMTEKFSFRCPLTGEAKVGRDWASTH